MFGASVAVFEAFDDAGRASPNCATSSLAVSVTAASTVDSIYMYSLPFARDERIGGGVGRDGDGGCGNDLWHELRVRRERETAGEPGHWTAMLRARGTHGAEAARAAATQAAERIEETLETTPEALFETLEIGALAPPPAEEVEAKVAQPRHQPADAAIDDLLGPQGKPLGGHQRTAVRQGQGHDEKARTRRDRSSAGMSSPGLAGSRGRGGVKIPRCEQVPAQHRYVQVGISVPGSSEQLLLALTLAVGRDFLGGTDAQRFGIPAHEVTLEIRAGAHNRGPKSGPLAAAARQPPPAALRRNPGGTT